MDDMYLREFIDLAATCNFQESAENMCISASSLSKHVAKMEQELGVPLFDRSTRTVSLNTYGEILLKYAKQIVALTDGYINDISSAHKIESSQLNIGFLPMLGRFGILDTITVFMDANPDITINILEATNLEEHLLDGKYNFVFVDAFGPKDPQITKILFKTDHLVAIFPENDPLASRESVTVEDMKDKKFLLQVTPEGEPTMTSSNFLNLCAKSGFTPKVSQTSRHISTIAKLVEGGRGVAILHSSEIRAEQNFRYSVVDIVPEVPFDIYVSYAPTRVRTDTAKAFLSFLRENAEK